MMFIKCFVASILDVSGQAPSVAIPSCGAKTGHWHSWVCNSLEINYLVLVEMPSGMFHYLLEQDEMAER